MEERVRREPGRGHYVVEAFGVAAFFALAAPIGFEVYEGAKGFGYAWTLPILAYLLAGLLSGFVHFLADNFGAAGKPLVGRNVIDAFREHHVDPKGITTHDFIDANGNNSLVSLPFMLVLWLAVPVATTLSGYLFGAFALMIWLAVFLTNQFHKWRTWTPRPPW